MANNICRYDFVKYGNYTFNSFVKTSASIQPVMSDDGHTVKYDRVTFQCEFIVSYETVEVSDPIAGGVDLEMNEIRKTLTTSGLSLEVSYRGLGTSRSATVSGRGIDVLTGVAEHSLLEGPFPELLDWEPIAGNRAVRCVWKVAFVRQRCENHYEKQMLTSPAAGYRDLLQSLVEEQDLAFNEAGAVVITLTGYIEFAGLLNQNKLDNEVGNGYSPVSRKSLQNLVGFFDSFIPSGFTRKSKFKFLKDSRSVSYTIVDTEIESDNPIFPYIVKADVTHEVSSSLLAKDLSSGAGFLSWANTFDGTFQVRPGVWKGWAWIAFCVYLFNRRSRACDQLKNPDAKAKDEKEGAKKDATVDENANKKRPPKQLPISLRIKEHILSRQVDISMRYLVTCSLKQLFEATGLFYPIDTLWKKKKVVFENPGNAPSITLQDTVFPDDIGTTPISALQGISGKSADPLTRLQQWNWYKNLTLYNHIYGYRNIQLPNSTLIYDPCETNAQDFAYNKSLRNGMCTVADPNEPYRPENSEATNLAETGYVALGSGNTGSANDPEDKASVNYGTSEYLSNLKPSDSWITRNDSITLVENTNASLLPSLESIGNNHLIASANPALTDKKKTGFNINNRNVKIEESKYTNHIAMAYGAPTYYIRSTGYAVRAGYSIQCPAVLGVYKSPTAQNLDESGNILKAIRIGVNKWTHKQICQSSDLPVYMAMWDVTYVLQGDPNSDNIVYSRNTPAEYV